MDEKNLWISEHAQKLLQTIKAEGPQKLHIVTDFDKTLTPAVINGQKSHTVIAQLREHSYLTKDYSKCAFALFDKYYPIEHDETISVEERAKHMVQWWSEHLELLKKCRLNQSDIKDIIDKGLTIPRACTFDFLDYLSKKNIPILIFSAGVGDCIEGFLRKNKRLTSNVHIISNFFDWDNKGYVVRYKGPIIHSLNKNEGHITGTEYEKEVKQRPNVILIGDNLHDVQMVEGLKHKNILKIGLQNTTGNETRARFRNTFDIVLEGDGSFKPILDILKEIVE